MNEDELKIPVYVVTGFLDSGKTSFLNYTIAQDYFQIDEPTLLIACEEGEEEYDARRLLRYHTTLTQIESEEDFTPARLRKLNRKFRPDRVIIEYNPLWGIKNLWEMELPDDWEIVQQIVTVDASTFSVYVNNMKSLFAEMSQNADMVIFNRSSSDMPLASFRRSIKVVNPACEVLFEDMEGNLTDFTESQLPYDTDGDVIEIDDVDYGIFYVDAGENPDTYDGKTVHFKGQVLKSQKEDADVFVPGRRAMTCCADDTAFIGYLCKSKNAPRLEMGSWVDVAATIRYRYVKMYGGEGPVLYAKKIAKAEPPRSELVYFT